MLVPSAAGRWWWWLIQGGVGVGVGVGEYGKVSEFGRNEE